MSGGTIEETSEHPPVPGDDGGSDHSADAVHTRAGPTAPTQDRDPTTAGPYLLLHRLGEGGMGVVYRAFDPRLDRQVAVKLMRTGQAGGPARSATKVRVLREAQAMAKLAHPNVVEIYDVGTAGDRVFIAMELVEGQTLKQWLRTSPPTAQILDQFIAAGRGLVAAHDKGLVHRDFKPDNVMLGADGRVRVSDFGLARASSKSAPSDSAGRGSSAAASAVPPPEHGSGDAFGRTALTGDGFVLGTPRYMAPEQHFAEATDARSDQYAFCVALYEALVGSAPFSAPNLDELAKAKDNLRFHDPTLHASMPAPIRRALLRGLQPELGDRWPSMAPLLAILKAQRTRPRNFAIAGLVGASAVGTVVLLSIDAAPSACDRAGAVIERAWGPDRATAVNRAVLQTGVSYAADTWTRLDARLVAYAQAWRSTHAQVCRERGARGLQPEDPADARTRCLARRLAELEGVVVLLEDADAAVVEQSIALVASLSPAALCGDEASAAAQGPEPPDAATLAAWLRMGQHAKTIEARARTGRAADALADAEQMLLDAQRADWPPLRAQALFAAGDAYQASDDLPRAKQAYSDCYWLCVEEELDLFASMAAAQMVFIMGEQYADEAEALQWAGHARSASARAKDTAALAQVATALGALYSTVGRPHLAAKHFSEAMELFSQRDGADSDSVAVMLSNLGSVHQALGDYPTALAHLQRAHAILTEQLGPGHPSVATAASNLAATMARLGRYDEAIVHQQRVVAMRRDLSGQRSTATALALSNLGAIEESAEQYDAAIEHQRAALDIQLELLPDAHPYRAAGQINLGMTLARIGRLDDADAWAVQSKLQLAKGPDDHPYYVYAAILEATIALARRDAAAARAAGDAADALCRRGVPLEPGVCAEARGLLARALWDDAPDDRERALTLARQAVRDLTDSEYTSNVGLRELQAWLATVDP